MIFLRSLIFNVFYVAYTLALSVLAIPVLVISGRAALQVCRFWAWSVLWALKAVCGLSYEVRGRDHLTALPVIYACKHQSAWDIVMLLVLLPRPAFVLKKELLRIPLVGWYMRRQGMIPVDRATGAGALKRMLKAAKRALHEHRPLVIYPEGTRTAPGAHRAYQPGVAALYAHLMIPAVPVALNSGLFWGRNAFCKRPGKVIIEFLPAISPGLPAREFLTQLENSLETASERLRNEALAN